MTEFPQLKLALNSWVSDAIDLLSRDASARDYTTDLGHWRPDADGVFRDIERPIEVWDRHAVQRLFDLPSWSAVFVALQGDCRLSSQVGTLIGTAHSGHRFEAVNFGRLVLPGPNELAHADGTFEARYQELESFLAAHEIEYSAIWPLPGLTCDVLPVRLDSEVKLDAMTDHELGFALDTEIVRTTFPRYRLLSPEAEHRTCFRYRYSLPKLVGDWDENETLRTGQEHQGKLQQIESDLKESLAIVLPDAVGIAGRFDIVARPGSPLAGGVAFQQATIPQSFRLRRAHLNDDQASDLVRVWKLLHKPRRLKRHKGLALALHRLSHQAQREQPEDELLDTMIAAEALYLTDLGDVTERGELRYRLALRAALWADPARVGFTRREVLSLMKSAYDARSAVAHGGTPKAEDMKVRGQRVSLPELTKASKSVVTAGCRAALERVASDKGGWPPDWDAMALSDCS